MQRIKSLLVDCAVLGSLIAGGFFNIEWAENIALFLLWVWIIGGFVVGCQTKEALQAMGVIKPHTKIRRYYRRSMVTVIVLILASQGWFVTTAGFVIGAIAMGKVAYDKALEA